MKYVALKTRLLNFKANYAVLELLIEDDISCVNIQHQIDSTVGSEKILLNKYSSNACYLLHVADRVW